jgi:hypothetical protein
MYVKYTENDNYTKNEGAPANCEDKYGNEDIVPLVLSIGSYINARQLYPRGKGSC